MIAEITSENFDAEVAGAGVPVLLDFWADWCGPCRMLSPVVDELSGAYDGRVKFGKVNVEEQPQLAANYGVQSIPTLILFRGGQPVDTSVGVVSKKRIETMLS